MNASIEPIIIQSIVEQHAEEAAFLWLLRNDAIKEPHYNLNDLADLDKRVEAHLNGLKIAGDAGWEICKQALELEEAGEVFAATVLALESIDGPRLESAIAVAAEFPETIDGLVSAFGWLPYKTVEPWLQSMRNASAEIHRYICIAAHAIHRVDPDPGYWFTAVDDASPRVKARALRAVGEFKHYDLLPQLQQQFNAEDPACRFWAVWSAILLRDSSAIEQLKPFFFDVESPFFEHALQIALRAMPITRSQRWLKTLADTPDSHNYIVEGVGIIGDPANIPWLIKQMETPEIARKAGEAVSMITGLDLAYDDLETDWPAGFEAGPTEDPEDPDVEMDPDEDLPWPDPVLLHKWLEENKSHYQAGIRYLCGQPIAVEHCLRVLRNGYQRQRRAVALELVLLQAQASFFNASAPGFWQQKILKNMTGNVVFHGIS